MKHKKSNPQLNYINKSLLTPGAEHHGDLHHQPVGLRPPLRLLQPPARRLRLPDAQVPQPGGLGLAGFS